MIWLSENSFNCWNTLRGGVATAEPVMADAKALKRTPHWAISSQATTKVAEGSTTTESRRRVKTRLNPHEWGACLCLNTGRHEDIVWAVRRLTESADKEPQS